jgi:hypothetical protein
VEENNQNEQKDHSLFVKQMLEVEVFPNLSQQVIMTTEDRLKLCLNENMKKAEKKNDWITPFSLLIAIITSFVTASFKDFIVSSKTWEAIFILVGIGSVIWLGLTIKNSFFKIDVEKIIDELKTKQNKSSKS